MTIFSGFKISTLGILALGLTAWLGSPATTQAQPVRDGSGIARKLVREPRYSAMPRYCLLAFGAEAATRVWLVLDGDTLYVDRNGNGDLTEAGEQVAGKDGVFKVGELREHGGERHTEVSVLVDQQIPQIDGTYKTRPYEVVMQVRGRYRAFGEPAFAASPNEAPILRFNAPLRLELLDPRNAAPGQVIDPRLILRAPGVGASSMVLMDHETIPRDLHPVVELEFTTPEGMQKTPLVLRRRCCGSIFMDTVQVPPSATGKIVVRASYPAWKDAVTQTTEFEIPLR